jgi:serine/threonine-protein kinase
VAFKVFYPAMFADETAMARFLRAAKTMLPIRHENLVTLYMAGRKEDFCFTASEFVEGESAAQLKERVGISGMLSWEQALRIAAHIGQALAVAEEHRIVHRNVTPQNILIRASDKVAKLGDLILAKAMEGIHAVQVTRPGELVGELAYMSPEQTAGDKGVDCRSDLYGLGATLYAVLTGRPPLEGRNRADMILKIQTQPPEKPTKYHLAISPMFEGVILRLLAKRPDDRYQTAKDLLADLARVAKFQGFSLPI